MNKITVTVEMVFLLKHKRTGSPHPRGNNYSKVML